MNGIGDFEVWRTRQGELFREVEEGRTTRPPPAGWEEVRVTGSRDSCLAHIEEVWTDIRPRSVREHLAWLAEQPEGAWLAPAEKRDDGSDLIARLGGLGHLKRIAPREPDASEPREKSEGR